MLNAIFAIVRSGCAWRMRPDDMPPWQTVSHSVRFWQRDGTWVRIHAALRTDVRVAAGREAAPSAAILDSQSVTTTENGGRTGLMLATTSTDAHAICWWIPWAWW
jgi:Transposase and inactivated derivatives